MRLSRALSVGPLALMLAACAQTTLFVGELETPDSQGVERVTQVYWYRKPLDSGQVEVGSLTLRTACAAPIRFEQAGDGLVFRGDPERDRLVGLVGEVGAAVRCARVETDRRLQEIGPGELRISIFCEPANNEFSVVKRNYPRASSEPYLFPVRAETRASADAAGLEPPPPACDE